MTRGRPAVAALLGLPDVADAVADRLASDLPVTAVDVGADLGISRRSLGRIVEREASLSWAAWISPILRTAAAADSDDPTMKRITVPLSDETFTQLRRRALAELRDPRLEARLLLEQSLSTASTEPRRLTERREPAA